VAEPGYGSVLLWSSGFHGSGPSRFWDTDQAD
jgi:hypothetical protein